jgi:hypothetical protein
MGTIVIVAVVLGFWLWGWSHYGIDDNPRDWGFRVAVGFSLIAIMEMLSHGGHF